MKKTTLRDSLLLKPKTAALPKSEVNLSETEKAVEKLHRPVAFDKSPATKSAEKKPTPTPKAAKMESFAAIYSRSARKAARLAEAPAPAGRASSRAAQSPDEVAAALANRRITLDIPQAMHAAMKIKTFQAGLTLREYLLGLAERDLFGK